MARQIIAYRERREEMEKTFETAQIDLNDAERFILETLNWGSPHGTLLAKALQWGFDYGYVAGEAHEREEHGNTLGKSDEILAEIQALSQKLYPKSVVPLL